MTPAELLDLHDELCQHAKALMVTKNQDYRGGTGDPFANFRGSTTLGIDPIIGILLRCQDKFQRIRSFVTNGTLAVKSESLEDAVVDVINYMVLLAGMAAERGPAPAEMGVFGLDGKRLFSTEDLAEFEVLESRMREPA